MKVRLEDYDSPVENAWCPGCGNFGILAALKRTLVELELAPHQVLVCTGIGQAPKLPHYLRVNTFNGLHGREVATATAAKLAASDLTVLVHAGDGGAYGEGGNHLIHAIRRNIDITLVVHDNHIYGLTKGQASPTTDQGAKVVLQPRGVAVRPMNPLALAISQSCAFVAQALASRTDQLVDLLKQAIRHTGFSFINVLQPCVSWDKVHTFKYYDERCFDLGLGDHLHRPPAVLAGSGPGGHRPPPPGPGRRSRGGREILPEVSVGLDGEESSKDPKARRRTHPFKGTRRQCPGIALRACS
ncbi:MAG: 2-oxoacid ferredoxin oxidoreductase [Deltaproteobacteria bacterium]|nr:2-oxoacid ferredoxin oxidoreductase [Deltaproteobacteria bacterium]